MTAGAATPRKSTLKAFLPVIIIIALAVSALWMIRGQLGPQGKGAGSGQLHQGAPLPDFNLGVYRGGSIPFSSLKGKVFLLNFWATWCEACVTEIPSLIQLREAYKDRGFELILINLDENPQQVLPSALRKFGIGFQVYLDQNSELSDLFEIHAIPLTVILNKNREVLLIESGERNWNGSDVRSLMDRWLSEKQ